MQKCIWQNTMLFHYKNTQQTGREGKFFILIKTYTKNAQTSIHAEWQSSDCFSTKINNKKGRYILATFIQDYTKVSSHGSKTIKEQKHFDWNGYNKSIYIYTCCDPVYKISKDNTKKCIKTNKQV